MKDWTKYRPLLWIYQLWLPFTAITLSFTTGIYLYIIATNGMP